MSPTQSRTNIDRTILRYLAAPDIAPMVPADDVRASQIDQPTWIRVQLTDISARNSGRIGSGRAERVLRRLTVECFCRMGTSDSEPIDGAQQIADQVADRVRGARMLLLDLVNDPTGATPTTHRMRCIAPPTITYASAIEGYAHRIVEADFDLFTVE